MHFFVDAVKSRTAAWRPSSSGWISGNCPVCVRMGEARPDTKRRGGFQFGQDEWVYHCFNCGFKTGWSSGRKLNWSNRTLLSGLGFDRSEIQRINIELMREEETNNFFNPDTKQQEQQFHPQWPAVELPSGSKSLSDFTAEQITKPLHDGLVMLQERQLLHWTDWAYTTDDFKYRNRIILPYRHQGKIVGYNARLVNNKTQTSKYLVTKPPHFVFNLDRQQSERSSVIIVEGDFDAISLDCVSLGTNSVSKEQASVINQLNKKTIMLPDADAAGAALIEPAIAQGWAVSFPEWMESYKDANAAVIDLGRPFVLASVLASATDNPTRIKVLAKKYLR